MALTFGKSWVKQSKYENRTLQPGLIFSIMVSLENNLTITSQKQMEDMFTQMNTMIIFKIGTTTLTNLEAEVTYVNHRS